MSILLGLMDGVMNGGLRSLLSKRLQQLLHGLVVSACHFPMSKVRNEILSQLDGHILSDVRIEACPFTYLIEAY